MTFEWHVHNKINKGERLIVKKKYKEKKIKTPLSIYGCTSGRIKTGGSQLSKYKKVQQIQKLHSNRRITQNTSSRF